MRCLSAALTPAYIDGNQSFNALWNIPQPQPAQNVTRGNRGQKNKDPFSGEESRHCISCAWGDGIPYRSRALTRPRVRVAHVGRFAGAEMSLRACIYTHTYIDVHSHSKIDKIAKEVMGMCLFVMNKNDSPS